MLRAGPVRAAAAVATAKKVYTAKNPECHPSNRNTRQKIP